MKQKNKTAASESVSEGILQKVGGIIPGFHGFFKKMEQSKTFGVRIGEIRKEIDRRFGSRKP
jgi:hypothetical protein